MSDVIREECSKSSSKTSKANLETKRSVLKPPMQLIIFFQRPEYNFVRDEFSKNKTKTALPAQYSMSFPGIYSKVLYIIVSIKLHIGNDIDKGHYVCYVLYYNTGTWWNFDDDTITQYPGYLINLYCDLSIDKKQKQNWKIVCMDISDRILSMLYIKIYILASST